MDFLDGRVAVVTGAADGIGRALSQALLAEGMHVVLADVDAPRLRRTAEELSAAADSEVLAVPTDVSDAGAVAELARAARDRFGAVHVLCNNAGVVLAPARLWKVPPAEIRWLLNINLWGVIHGIQAFVPSMIAQGEPAHVVNTASISGVLGFPRIGAYGASKFAIVGLSESLLLDLHERQAPIGVSVVCPGATATALNQHSERLRGAAHATDGGGDEEGIGVTPAQVAAEVVDAVREDRFWVLTHPAYRELLEARHQAMLTGAHPLTVPGFFL